MFKDSKEYKEAGIAGIDFRNATDEELDRAINAYKLYKENNPDEFIYDDEDIDEDYSDDEEEDYEEPVDYDDYEDYTEDDLIEYSYTYIY